MPFFGWELPIWFSKATEEHHAVRNASGVFDVSHMGLLTLSADNATYLHDSIQKLSCRKLNFNQNKLNYTFFLNKLGGIIDDIIIGQDTDTSLFCVVNASNKDKVIQWLSIMCPDVHVTDCMATHGLIAWQGPDVKQSINFDHLNRFQYQMIDLMGHNVRVMRTGYTGEDGIEVWATHTDIQHIYDALRTLGVKPCGLAARDSLRIEAGLPLYGHELSEGTTPYDTRYRSTIVSDDHDFIGRKALEHLDASQTITGLVVNSRAIPRYGMPIQSGGYITSGTRIGNRVIAMASLPEAKPVGSIVTVMIRNQAYPAEVVPLPFL